jgi:hypothetical protein
MLTALFVYFFREKGREIFISLFLLDVFGFFFFRNWFHKSGIPANGGGGATDMCKMLVPAHYG